MAREAVDIVVANAGNKIADILRSSIYTDASPQAPETAAQMNTWDHIKLKSLCTAKGTTDKMERRPHVRENIIATDTSEKGWISKMESVLIQRNERKTKNPVDRNENKQTPPKNETQEDMRSITHHQREANETNKEVPPHTCQNGRHQRIANHKCWRGCGEKGTLVHCWGQCRLVRPLWKSLWCYRQRVENGATIWPTGPSSRRIGQEA